MAAGALKSARARAKVLHRRPLPLVLRTLLRHQEWDVVSALSEAGNGDRKNAKAKVQVLSKAAGSNLRCQIDVARRNHANVDRNGLGPADPLDVVFLECAEKFALGRVGQRRNFVEK
jgi:hypothetical protein